MRKINYLIALAKIGHFGRAAEACHISQPAFSSAIQHLEEELGVTLIQRGHRFMGLTPEGERILQRAQQLAADWESLKQEATLASHQLTGTLRLGAIPTTLAVTPLFTDAYRKQYPGIHFELTSLCAEQIIRKLDSFELDMGLTYLEDPRLQGFNVLPLYRENHVLLARQLNIGESLQTLDWKAAAKLPLCLLTPNMQNRQLINSAFRKARVKPNIVVETDSIFALYAHVRCAGLFAIVPHSLLNLIEMRQEVAAIPLEPILSRDVGLIVRRHEMPSPLQDTAWNIAQSLELQQRFDAMITLGY
jgi:DNA-binding transcriptional LysR family regulator